MIKGLYIWQIRNCENGNIERIVTRAKAAKLSHVLIKIANGAAGYNYIDGVDKAKELADALKIEGIDPIGWQYVFGVDPYGEAMTANRRMRETGCLGFAIDAEKEYRDDPANKAKATTYMANLDFPEPKAFASYRYPEVHPKMPYGVFLAGCDLVMPQVYWMEANNPTEQLDECIKQYRKITDLPILPTGSAFCEHGWCPTKQEIIDFAEHAKSLDLPGVNFWEWANTVANDFWITVKDIEWEETEPPVEPPVDCCEELTDALMDYGRVVEANATKIEELEARAIFWDLNIDNHNKLVDRFDELEESVADLLAILQLLMTRIEVLENKTIPETNHTHWWQRLFKGD